MQPVGDHLEPSGSRYQPDGIRGDPFFYTNRIEFGHAILANEIRAIGNEH